MRLRNRDELSLTYVIRRFKLEELILHGQGDRSPQESKGGNLQGSVQAHAAQASRGGHSFGQANRGRGSASKGRGRG